RNDSTKTTSLCTPAALAEDAAYIKSVIDFGQECVKCNDSARKYQWVVRSKANLYNDLINLHQLTDTVVAYGYAELDSTGSAFNYDTVKLDKRITNLKRTS